ncbi:MAG: VWA domain-containing protein, partial [Planctomycetes bacterium]|nr:VWA domain-containing protein [Planctomycetota bacterium]
RRLLDKLLEMRGQFAESERNADKAGLDQSDRNLLEQAQELSGWSRLKWVDELISPEFLETAHRQHPQQAFPVRLLHDASLPEALSRPDFKTQDRSSDFLSALLQISSEENKMPLSGIFLFSDGRLNGSHPDVTQALEQLRNRKIPVYTVGVGSFTEPEDIAILKI